MFVTCDTKLLYRHNNLFIRVKKVSFVCVFKSTEATKEHTIVFSQGLFYKLLDKTATIKTVAV